MEKEIQIPEFVNENYNIRREVQTMEQRYNEYRRVRKIEFMKNSCRKILIAVALTGGIVVASKTPMMGKVINMIVSYDDKKFEQHIDMINEEVYENTGKTISDQLFIMENNDLTNEEIINNEKGSQSYR